MESCPGPPGTRHEELNPVRNPALVYAGEDLPLRTKTVFSDVEAVSADLVRPLTDDYRIDLRRMTVLRFELLGCIGNEPVI